MTRRRAIAGAGLCALLLPGCLGGKGTDPRTGRPGFVLIEPSRGQGLYAKPKTSQPPDMDSPGQTSPSAPQESGLTQRPAQQLGTLPPLENMLANGPPPLPPPDQVGEQFTGPTQVARSDQPAIGPDWDKLRRALSNGQFTSIRRASASVPSSPAARLELPVKAGPFLPNSEQSPYIQTDSSLKLSDPPPLLPDMHSAPPPLPDTHPAAPAGTPQPIKNIVLPQNNAPAPAPIGTSLPPTLDAAALESPLLHAIRAYQDKQPEKALEYLKQYDAANQEMMLYLVPLMVRLGERDLGTMSPEEIAAFVDRLQGMTGMMRARAALRLDTVCFCRRVFNYGKYEPLDARHSFQPGEPVQLYSEVRNFTWEPASSATAATQIPAGGRGFTMRLQNTLEIRDALGKVVWRADLPKSDTRQTPPSDYYLVYSFAMPDGLPPGAYTLEVKVADKPTGRVVRKAVDFRMGVRQ